MVLGGAHVRAVVDGGGMDVDVMEVHVQWVRVESQPAVDQRPEWEL